MILAWQPQLGNIVSEPNCKGTVLGLFYPTVDNIHIMTDPSLYSLLDSIQSYG